MRNWIIKLLGGITKDMYKKAYYNWEHQYADNLELMRQKTFRVGDRVYIKGDKNFNPHKAYYLLEKYSGTGGDCWYVGDRKDSSERNSLINGVLAENISHDKPTYCELCNRPIN